MAFTAKVQKIYNTGLAGASAGTTLVLVTVTDPATPGYTPVTVAASVPNADLLVDGDLQTDLDAAVQAAISGATIDWAL